MILWALTNGPGRAVFLKASPLPLLNSAKMSRVEVWVVGGGGRGVSSWYLSLIELFKASQFSLSVSARVVRLNSCRSILLPVVAMGKMPCPGLLSFLYWALSGWVRLWKHVWLHPSSSNGYHSCSCFKLPSYLCKGSVVMGRGERWCFFLGDHCFCPSYTAGSSVNPAASPPLLPSPEPRCVLGCICSNALFHPCPPLLLIQICPPSDVLTGGSFRSGIFLYWAGGPLLNYNGLTCNFKKRNKRVFSLHHDADITLWVIVVFI